MQLFFNVVFSYMLKGNFIILSTSPIVTYEISSFPASHWTVAFCLSDSQFRPQYRGSQDQNTPSLCILYQCHQPLGLVRPNSHSIPYLTLAKHEVFQNLSIRSRHTLIINKTGCGITTPFLHWSPLQVFIIRSIRYSPRNCNIPCGWKWYDRALWCRGFHRRLWVFG